MNKNTETERPFLTTWMSCYDNHIIIPVHPNSAYDYNVTWTNLTHKGVGDGSVYDCVSEYKIEGLTSNDTYLVAITGLYPQICMKMNSNRSWDEARKLQTIAQWGTNPWVSMESAFKDCLNLHYTATDTPDLRDRKSVV